MTDDVHGFSVQVPAGYTRIKDNAMLQSLTADASVNPGDQKLKARLVEYAPTVEQARVFAFKRGADFNDNFNVLVASTDGLAAENVDDLYGRVKRVLEEKLDATNIDHRVISVSGTKAMRLDYRTHAGQIPVRGTQVYVIHNGVILALTVTQNDVQTHMADVDKIIDSLRLQ